MPVLTRTQPLIALRGFFLTGGFQFVNGVFGNDLRVEQRFVDIGRIPKAVGDIDCTDSLTEMQKFIVKKGFFSINVHAILFISVTSLTS